MNDPFESFESALTLNENNAPMNNQFEDPAADFLAREQAEFAEIENNTFGDFSAVQPEPVVSNGFDDNDPFGLGSVVNNDFTNNETKPVQSNNANSVASDIQDSDWVLVDTNNPSKKSDLYSAISSVDKLTNEPEQLKTWREDQKDRLQAKDAEEEQKKKDLKEAARKELEDWYKHRQEQLEKTHASNKAAEADLVGPRDLPQGQEWDRVTKLCDFNPKANKNTRDVGRMRSILLQLKQQPLAR